METIVLDNVLDRLRTALERNDWPAAAALIESLRPPDQAELIAELNDDQQADLLPRLNPEDSADILEQLEDEEAADLVASLSTAALIAIVDRMEPDRAADLLGDLEPEQAQAILAGLEDADEVRPLLLHPDDSAGGLMTSEFLALRRRMTAGEAINSLRAWQPESQAIYYLFVVDAQGHLSGVVSLRRLVVADPQTLVRDLMDPEVISVRAGADQEECARLMGRYDLLALPVVDASNRLMGVITIDDVVDVLEDEATEDIQRLGGAQPLSSPYLDSGVFAVTRARIGWLLLLFITGSLTASVIRAYQGELEAAVALTLFVPLLIGTGGNAGAQTTSTVIRALATGHIDFSDFVAVWWHEARVGLVLGLGMAAAAFLRVFSWSPDMSLSLTVSFSVLGIVLWSTGVGAVLPLLADRLGIDPTVVSGPVMSTLVDATGLLIYFNIARIILGL